MNAFFPELLVIVDLIGFGLTLWLGLHLITHGFGWQPGRARVAALALWSLTCFFALGTYDSFDSLAGPDLTAGGLRLLLLPLPIFWVLLAQRLAPAVLRARVRLAFVFVLAAAFLALGVNLMTGHLQPEQISYSWIYLPAYVAALFLGMIVTLSLSWRSRRILGSTQERRVMLMIGTASLLGLGGANVLAGDFVFGLGSPYLYRFTLESPDEMRLAGSGLLLLASLLLSLAIILQARADGAAHISNLTHSFLVTMVMTLLYMGLGGFAILYWELPLALLALFLFLALMTDWFDNATRGGLERFLYRGTTGKLLRNMRVVATNIENPDKLPPAIRPLLSHLARQLNSPQLGLALPEENNRKEYRIVAALRPAWEGQKLDVKDGTTWEERGVGGWNMPLRHNNQTIGIIASDKTGSLNQIQHKLLQNTANQMAEIMMEWKALKREQETLRNTLEQYRRRAELLDAKFIALATPSATAGDMRRAVAKLLNHYNDSATKINKLPLAKLKLIETLLPTGVSGPENRAKALKDLCASLVEQLRPIEGQIPTDPTVEWYPYLVASQVYVQGQSEDEFLIRYKMKNRTFKKAKQAAIDSLARMIAELETGVIQQDDVKKATERAAAQTAPSAPSYGATSRQSPSTATHSSSTTGTSSITGTSSAASRPFTPSGNRPGSTTPASKPVTSQQQGVLGRLKGRFKPGQSPSTGQSSSKPQTGGVAQGLPAAKASTGGKKGSFGRILSSFRRTNRSADQNVDASNKKGGGLTGRLGSFASRFIREKPDKAPLPSGSSPASPFPRLAAKGNRPGSTPAPGNVRSSDPGARRPDSTNSPSSSPPGSAPISSGSPASVPGQSQQVPGQVSHGPSQNAATASRESGEGDKAEKEAGEQQSAGSQGEVPTFYRD